MVVKKEMCTQPSGEEISCAKGLLEASFLGSFNTTLAANYLGVPV
jgi:hypothetical protein